VRRGIAEAAGAVADAVAVGRIVEAELEERRVVSMVEEWSIDVGVGAEVATAAVGASGIVVAEAFGYFVA
jgi:hypothetical protein